MSDNGPYLSIWTAYCKDFDSELEVLQQKVDQERRLLDATHLKVQETLRVLEGLENQVRQVGLDCELLAEKKATVYFFSNEISRQLSVARENLEEVEDKIYPENNVFLNHRILELVKDCEKEFCSICLESFSDDKGIQVLKCGHFLCAVCFEEVDKCPECRAQFCGDIEQLNKIKKTLLVELDELLWGIEKLNCDFIES